MPALDYLIAINRKGLGDDVPAFDNGALDAAGKHVVVIGGGDTAMDCVRTAVRQGATSVNCLYRRDRANMPGSHARGEERRGRGRASSTGWPRPRRFVGEGAVQRRARAAHASRPARCDRPPDSRSRSRASDFDLPADLVIKALGFDPEDLPALFGEPALAVTRWGTLKIDYRTMMTNAATACSPPATSCAAHRWWCGRIRDGRDAADQIHGYIAGAGASTRRGACAAE